MFNHPLFQTLRELKGNPRITVLTEVMFGIPYNLFMPFFSVYMLALGVTDPQIGSIASLGLIIQVFTALLSGVIVDKFGRRLTLFICNILCWSVPCLIWAVAEDVRFFVAAALMNSLWRISHTAWTCLMVEDAEELHQVHIWTWIMIFAVCSAFIAPLGGWFVEHLGLVPAMRALFLFGFIALTANSYCYMSTRTKRFEVCSACRNPSSFNTGLIEGISKSFQTTPAFKAHSGSPIHNGDYEHLHNH